MNAELAQEIIREELAEEVLADLSMCQTSGAAEYLEPLCYRARPS